MKHNRVISQLQFSVLVITPFLLSLFLLALLFGCSNEKPKAPEAPVLVTVENMQIAYGKGLKFHHMYHDFEGQATRERLPNIAQRYAALSRSEEVHAALHAEWLKQHGAEPKAPVIDTVTVGKTLQTLKMSLSMEEIESASMYPNLIRTAELEKLTDAVAQLTTIKDADAEHTKLLQEVLDKTGRIEKTTYFVCTKCGYILTSGAGADCPNCHAAKTNLEKVI